MEAESRQRWRLAALFYRSAARQAIEGGDHEAAAELYMTAAVCMEREEEWRDIGLLWLHCAAALQGEADPIGKGRYVDADSAKHLFPVIEPSFWRSLPREERRGRALRNAGYHLEKAGVNQSAYRQYQMAGSVFQDGSLWDEASRSYMLAALSYVGQHGELDPELLTDLERSLDKLEEENPNRYLKRLVHYYRHLRAVLTDHGNSDQANQIYVNECVARMRLHRVQGRYLTAGVLGLWGLTSRYGTSFGRWLLVTSVLALLVFPILFAAAASPLETAAVGSRFVGGLFQSLNAIRGNADLARNVPALTTLLTLLETIAGYAMLGSLVAMVVARITR